MNKLLYLLFLSVFFLNFLHSDLAIIPRSVTYMPEGLAVLTFLIVLLRFAVTKKVAIHEKYIYLILSYLIIISIGSISNGTPPRGIFVGMRFHLKYLPLFFLPAVYRFSDEQFKKQLQFILPLLILQCPLAFYQRLIQYRGVLTGDGVTGTLNVSSVLSITLICSIAVIFAMYLKKKIPLAFFAITAVCLFLPTTLNETKGTLFLLPIALVLPAVFCEELLSPQKAKNLLTTVLIGVLFISAFIPIYDHFMKPRMGHSIFGFFQNKRQVKEYLYRGANATERRHIRRGDAIVLAYKNLSKDPLTLMFGLGIGNVVYSHFDSFRGNHTDKLQCGADFLALTSLFWELGLSGIIVYIAFYFFFFRDAFLLKNSDDIFGSFSLGWTAVVVVICLSLLYKNTFQFNVLTFLFWYFSGIVAAETFRIRRFRESSARRLSTPLASHDCK